MTWGRNVLTSIDCLGNALSGGRWDITISARVGWLAYIRKTKLGKFLKVVVDFTFYPIDGYGHCYWAYVGMKDRQPTEGRVSARIALAIITTAGCIIIYPFILVGAGVTLLQKIRIFKPNKRR